MSTSTANHPSPGFHRMNLPPKVLATILADRGRVYDGIAEFVVTTPDVRCRLRLDLIFCPDPGAPTALSYYWGNAGFPRNFFDPHSLWLTKRAESALHGCGQVNVQNLVGDVYAGEPIPEPGCLGYHVEAETCADEIWGRFAVGGGGHPTTLPAGIWVLRVAADAKDQMSEDEWRRVLSRFAVRVDRSCSVSNNEGSQ